MLLPLPRSTLFPYTTLFRSQLAGEAAADPQARLAERGVFLAEELVEGHCVVDLCRAQVEQVGNFADRLERQDRKSTRLNSSHRCISYAVFCLKKKKKKKKTI